MSNSVIILAAGKGTRLGMPHPKPLTKLANGSTIMERQLDGIRHTFGYNTKANIVVGFQLEKIIDAFPNEQYIYNDVYDQTNTSKSLLRALKAIPKKSGALWMNGDVVFSEELLPKLLPLMAEEQSFVSVNTSKVSDEEVKYTLDEFGYIDKLSKVVKTQDALGEAVGINYVSAIDKPALIRALSKVDDNDYFERGIELAIEAGAGNYLPIDISRFGFGAMEVDFQGDLEQANRTLLASIK